MLQAERGGVMEVFLKLAGTALVVFAVLGDDGDAH